MPFVLGAGECGGTQSPDASGPKVAVTIPYASYDDHSDTPNAVKGKCKFHEELPKAIVSNTPGASLSTGGSEKILSLVVVTMRGVESTWEGDSSVIVRGELRESGTEIGTFRIKYSASPGVLGGASGRCQALDEIAELMAEDITPWLRDPKPTAKLGE